MNKHLIALDLDGTLLAKWDEISEQTKTYLKELGKVHDIVIATGRPFRSTERFHQELGLDTPLINYNGGLVTSKHDPSFKPYSVTMKKEYIHDIFENNLDIIDNAFGEVQDDIFLYKDTDKIRPLLHYFNGAKLFTGHIKDILQEDPNGFLVLTKKGKAQELEDYVNTHFEGKVNARNWGEDYHYVIELFNPETNKAKGLDYVAKHLGYNADQVIAFGDAGNDIEMLQYAKIGIAMKNAQERLKKHADIILDKTNQEDGIIHFLKDYLK
ncbi:MAG: Cof-type HAD-IIB family hydrolase [Candidatus Izimaplasma sp.]|nr:Cof-type HAD-IIB family hydrolase [Candidatus Izimaplasma bacterium]